MKIKWLLMIIILLLMMTPVIAESDSYSFNVANGSNMFNLGTSYDGNYVNSINGTFYPAQTGAQHQQRITINSETALNNATMKLEIPHNQFMKSDFSDIRFEYLNGTNIQYYLNEKTNGVNATVYLKMNVVAGQNNINMKFNFTNSTSSQSNITNMFLYSMINSSGVWYNNSGYTTIYSGQYTNTDYLFKGRYYGSSNYTKIAHNSSYANNNAFPYFYMSGTTDGSFALSSGNSLKISNGYGMDNSTTGVSIDATNCSQTKINLVNYYPNITTVYSVNSTEGSMTYPMNSFIVYRPNNFVNATFYKIFIYNSTSHTIQFGSVETLPSGESEPVTLNIPSGIFSFIPFNSNSPGQIIFNVNYSPHLFMLTPDNANISANGRLQFQSHPASLTTTYQIALDHNYYSAVSSGTSSGNISLSLPEGTYYWRLMQPNGTYTETRSFNISAVPAIPGYLNFKIVNELNNSTISATVKLTNETTTLQKTGNNVTFTASEIISGNYSVQVSAANFTTRFYEVVSPGNYTFYLLPTTENYSIVYFSLIDNTNTFQYDSTKLEIIKQTSNGQIVIQNSYFDASGLIVASLNQFENYVLKVVSDSGHEKIIGNYIQAEQSTVQLVISDIILKENNSSLYGGFTYNLTKSESAIKFDWINPNNALIEPLLFQIYKNDDVVMNISSDAPFGSINYQDNVDGEMKLDPDATYRIVMTAKTANGTIKINEYYKVGEESVGIDFEKIPLALRIVISLILLILVASMFNITNAKFSAIVVTLVAGFLALVGFLPILSSVLIWLLFVAIVAYKTNNR